MSETDEIYLNKNEFKELDEKSKWNYIEGLMKQLNDYKIMADSNCGDCIYRIQTKTDVNIDLYFEDWRTCAKNCDYCNIESLKEMCQTQFELINHMANSLVELQMKQNMLVKFLYRKDDSGKKLLDLIEKQQIKKKSVENYFR
jgi:hypothetical protein